MHACRYACRETVFTQVSNDLLDHVLEHAPAVLWVQERQELFLVEELVSRGAVGLEPAILQALQNLLCCSDGHTHTRFANCCAMFTGFFFFLHFD